jgi:hypothetical protein
MPSVWVYPRSNTEHVNRILRNCKCSSIRRIAKKALLQVPMYLLKFSGQLLIKWYSSVLLHRASFRGSGGLCCLHLQSDYNRFRWMLYLLTLSCRHPVPPKRRNRAILLDGLKARSLLSVSCQHPLRQHAVFQFITNVLICTHRQPPAKNTGRMNGQGLRPGAARSKEIAPVKR